MIENMTSDFYHANLATFSREGHDDEATRTAVRILGFFYATDNDGSDPVNPESLVFQDVSLPAASIKSRESQTLGEAGRLDPFEESPLEDKPSAHIGAFDPVNFKPLSFRDAPVHAAVAKLAAVQSLDESGQAQLAVLSEALTVEERLLGNTPLVSVLPDLHHWNFAIDGPPTYSNPYELKLTGKEIIINAWPELRYAGLLSNPHDPCRPEFDESFVLDPYRLLRQTEVISLETGLSRERLLQTAFVNAAQVMGRRIVYGTPEGQCKPDFWVKYANTARVALNHVYLP